MWPKVTAVRSASTSNQLHGRTLINRHTMPRVASQHLTVLRSTAYFFGPVNWRSQKAENWEKRLTLSPIKRASAKIW